VGRRGHSSAAAVSVLRAAAVAGALIGMALLLLSCGSEDDPLIVIDGETATPAGAEDQARADGEMGVIVITEDGFSPDSLEVTVGSIVQLKNETEQVRAILINGHGPEEPVEIEPGDTFEVDLEPGAYVITSPGDTKFTASVVVI
jgi:hypothetical protein